MGGRVFKRTPVVSGETPADMAFVLASSPFKEKERLREGTLEGRNTTGMVVRGRPAGAHRPRALLASASGPAALPSSNGPPPSGQRAEMGSMPSHGSAAAPAATGPPAKRPRVQAGDDKFPAMPALNLANEEAGRIRQDVTWNFGETLGHGAFGTVVAAEIGSQPVAIKIFRGASGRMQALREAMALERCAHPSIMGLLDAWTEGPTASNPHWGGRRRQTFLVFPKYETTLERYMREEPGGLSLHGCRELMGSLCRGAACIHEKGLVHTDLKPANVLMDSAPPDGKVFLTDLGCCVEAMRPPIPPHHEPAHRPPILHPAGRISRYNSSRGQHGSK